MTPARTQLSHLYPILFYFVTNLFGSNHKHKCAGRYELQQRQWLLSFFCSSVIAGMGGIKNIYTVFVTKSRHRWEDVTDTGCEDVGRFVLLQWQALVNTTMALCIHTRCGISWLGKRLSGSQGLCCMQSDGRCVSCLVWRCHCWYEDIEIQGTLKRRCGILVGNQIDANFFYRMFIWFK